MVRDRVALAGCPVVSQKSHRPLTVQVHALFESTQRGEHRRDLSAPMQHLCRLISALQEQEHPRVLDEQEGLRVCIAQVRSPRVLVDQFLDRKTLGRVAAGDHDTSAPARSAPARAASTPRSSDSDARCSASRLTSSATRELSACPSGNSPLITSAPPISRTFRVVSCAQTAPKSPEDAPITATGLPRRQHSGNGRDAQSSAFFNTPGVEPLNSGVAIRTPSARAIASRNLATGGSAGSRSRSKS